MSRCLYNDSFEEFISADENLIFGVIDGGAHGVTLTTAILRLRLFFGADGGVRCADTFSTVSGGARKSLSCSRLWQTTSPIAAR